MRIQGEELSCECIISDKDWVLSVTDFERVKHADSYKVQDGCILFYGGEGVVMTGVISVRVWCAIQNGGWAPGSAILVALLGGSGVVDVVSIPYDMDVEKK